MIPLVDIVVCIISAIVPAIASILCVVLTNRSTRQRVEESSKQLKEDMDAKQNQILQLTLKSNIQTVHSAYRQDRCMPSIVYEGVCDMYDAYKSAGGNSYVKSLVTEMQTWDKY